MIRTSFISSCSAVAAALAASPAFALDSFESATTTQAKVLADLPRPVAGDWVRLILGTGVAYQKQIGVATEATEQGRLAYLETQVGLPGGSCNPNTMKRTYLRTARFDSLLAPQAVLADVADSGTTLTRWADVDGGQSQAKNDATLHLLDAPYLYDDRPLRIVSSKKEMLQLPAPIAYLGAEDSSRGMLTPHETTHVVADLVGPTDAKHQLARVELWMTPVVPFGLAKYRAEARDVEPFEMHVYSYGTHFKSSVAMTLKTIRSITPDGTYVDAG